MFICNVSSSIHLLYTCVRCWKITPASSMSPCVLLASQFAEIKHYCHSKFFIGVHVSSPFPSLITRNYVTEWVCQFSCQVSSIIFLSSKECNWRKTVYFGRNCRYILLMKNYAVGFMTDWKTVSGLEFCKRSYWCVQARKWIYVSKT